jgi:uroporphyrinogen-III synthase
MNAPIPPLIKGGEPLAPAPSPLIALTRNAKDNQPLAAAIHARLPQARFIDWPLLGFTPPADPTIPLAAIDQIAPGDWLIFVSPRAVHYAQALRPLHSLPACHWAAVGAATKAAIQAAFPAVPPVLSPSTTQDSEGLLQALPLSSLHGQRVWLFRGDSGREHLKDSLIAHGARVDVIAVYTRICAPLRPVRPIRPELWIIHAPAALSCLRRWIDSASSDAVRRGLLHCRLIVINHRTAEQARAFGFTGSITCAQAPDDTALTEALMQALATKPVPLVAP